VSTREPRELLAVLVEGDERTVAATVHLGDLIEKGAGAEWFTYGLAVTGRDGGATKHFAVRFSGDQRSAFVFDFDSNTQANYDGSNVDVHETSTVARFPDATLGLNWAGSLSGFSTVEGDDVTVEAPVQVLKTCASRARRLPALPLEVVAGDVLGGLVVRPLTLPELDASRLEETVVED